jgi:hypothetical protein
VLDTDVDFEDESIPVVEDAQSACDEAKEILEESFEELTLEKLLVHVPECCLPEKPLCESLPSPCGLLSKEISSPSSVFFFCFLFYNTIAEDAPRLLSSFERRR